MWLVRNWVAQAGAFGLPVAWEPEPALDAVLINLDFRSDHSHHLEGLPEDLPGHPTEAVKGITASRRVKNDVKDNAASPAESVTIGRTLLFAIMDNIATHRKAPLSCSGPALLRTSLSPWPSSAR